MRLSCFVNTHSETVHIMTASAKPSDAKNCAPADNLPMSHRRCVQTPDLNFLVVLHVHHCYNKLFCRLGQMSA